MTHTSRSFVNAGFCPPYRRREFLRHPGGHEYGGSEEVSAGKWRGDLQSLINMAVNRTLSKRVQKLDTRLIPTEERRVIHISAVHLMASRHADNVRDLIPFDMRSRKRLPQITAFSVDSIAGGAMSGAKG
jgi:hypothetical protein